MSSWYFNTNDILKTKNVMSIVKSSTLNLNEKYLLFINLKMFCLILICHLLKLLSSYNLHFHVVPITQLFDIRS